MTKAEATRATGLSPNAISTILFALQEETLLLREQSIRGRMGQHRQPTHVGMRAFLKKELRSLLRSANLRRDDTDAPGVALPSKLWHWTDDFDAPKAEMEA